MKNGAITLETEIPCLMKPYCARRTIWKRSLVESISGPKMTKVDLYGQEISTCKLLAGIRSPSTCTCYLADMRLQIAVLPTQSPTLSAGRAFPPTPRDTQLPSQGRVAEFLQDPSDPGSLVRRDVE